MAGQVSNLGPSPSCTLPPKGPCLLPRKFLGTMTSSLWPQLSLTRCTSGGDSHTGFLPKAVRLAWREHSLELTTCPPCRDNGGCLCRPTLMSSELCSGLLAWLALRFQYPSDGRFFLQISLLWKTYPSLLPSPIHRHDFCFSSLPHVRPPTLFSCWFLKSHSVMVCISILLQTGGLCGSPKGGRLRPLVLTTANTMDTSA